VTNTRATDSMIEDWIKRAPDDFRSRVMDRLQVSESGCWLWTLSPGSPYGRTRLPQALGHLDPWGGGRITSIHRAVWVSLRGAVPEGMVLDHDEPGVGCGNKKCANPAHMTAATPARNSVTGGGSAAINYAREECSNGHSLEDEGNWLPSGMLRGKRTCWTCNRETVRRRDELIRSAVSATGMTWTSYVKTHGKSTRKAMEFLAAEGRK